jgi:hypothetical protein
LCLRRELLDGVLRDIFGVFDRAFRDHVDGSVDHARGVPDAPFGENGQTGTPVLA